jgi:hypothetical protein
MKSKHAFALAAFAATFSLAAATVPEPKLAEACAALQRTPLAAAEIQTLLDVSRQADYNPALRGRAMAAFSLTLLMQGDTNGFERAVQGLRTAYPNAAPLVTVTREAAFTACADCKGKGVQTTICPACKGLGTCKSCDATGQKDGAACATCKGRGACALCAGKKRISTPCAPCRGTRLVFKPSEAIRANYNALLAESVALVEENARYAEQYRAASRESDTAKRIALLTALLGAYPHRTDLGPAQSLLVEAVNTRNAREAARLEREARDRETRELESLRVLRETKDLNGAIATLSTYLQEHPKVAAYLELKVLLDELVAKRNRAALIRKVVYGILALAGTLFLAACLRPLLFRPRREGSGPLPGMDKVDMDKFTDPLTLNSTESKARVKTKTTNLAQPKN